MNLLIQSLLIGFVALFGYANAIMGSSMLDRPLVISPLVGLVLGDLQMGIMVGATLELVWLGAFPVGASNPPDMVSGTIIGASFVISSGSESGTAVALAVPIATLVLMLSNILMMFVIPQLCCVMADRNAAKGNVKGVEHAHLLAVSIFLIPLSLLVAVSYYVGAPFIADIVKSIPAFITHGGRNRNYPCHRICNAGKDDYDKGCRSLLLWRFSVERLSAGTGSRCCTDGLCYRNRDYDNKKGYKYENGGRTG